MGPEHGTIEWSPGKSVGTRFVASDGSLGMVLAHGAGTDQDHRLVVGLRDRLAAAGVPVLTFDYPYTAEGRRRPDRAEVLLACHRAVVEHATDRFGSVPVVGGRSMGGRMATMLAAGGGTVAGVAAYAYPLHPPGRLDRLRVDHLPAIEVPVLMVVGERDTMCDGVVYDATVRGLPQVTTHVLADADHSWRVPKRTGRTEADVMDEAVAATVVWMGSLGS